jgi:hypothetical protein
MHCRHKQIHNRPHRRRGTLYIGVMMTALIVAVIGLSGLAVSHLGIETAQNTRDAETAAILARAAAEELVRQLNTNPLWRSIVVSGNESTFVGGGGVSGGGSTSYRVVDLDGSFSNNLSDGVRIYCIGKYGWATYVESVLVQPSTTGVTCLQSALHCQGNIVLESYCNVVTPQWVSSNGSIFASATQSDITGSAQAVGSINGSVSGTRSSGVAARQMPGNTVFEYYRANGTWIDITSIPLVSNVRTVNSRLFAPTVNPFGVAGNVEGIYVIDCKGQNLQIQNSRVYGTLVILNPGTTCCFQGRLSIAPVSPNFPGVMVQGGAQFDMEWNELHEGELNTNFNPPGAPFEDATDTDTADRYPSRIKGLTYISGKLKIKANLAGESAFEGSVVCSTMEFEGTGDARFTYRPTHLNNPPPGFATGGAMRIVPGTWRRDTLP